MVSIGACVEVQDLDLWRMVVGFRVGILRPSLTWSNARDRPFWGAPGFGHSHIAA